MELTDTESQIAALITADCCSCKYYVDNIDCGYDERQSSNCRAEMERVGMIMGVFDAAVEKAKIDTVKQIFKDFESWFSATDCIMPEAGRQLVNAIDVGAYIALKQKYLGGA